MFTGAMVALVTPFHGGEIDFETLDELVDFQLDNGIDAIVPVGRPANARRSAMRSTSRLSKPWSSGSVAPRA